MTLAQESVQNFTKPQKGIDYLGNDISNNGETGFHAATAEDCASICNAISSCVGFVYYPVTFTGDIYGFTGVTVNAGSCYPKDAMVTPYAFPNGSEIYAYFNALANFTRPQKGIDYLGNDISNNGETGFHAATAEDCASICNAISSCAGFVYYPVTFTGDIYGFTGVTINAGSCYPKDAMVTPNAFPNGSEIYAYLRNPRCIPVISKPTAGYCAGVSLRYNVCAANAVAGQAAAAGVTQVANEFGMAADAVDATCSNATAAACTSWLGTQAKPGTCNRGAICTVASTMAVYLSSIEPGSWPVLYNQCERDADCGQSFTTDLGSPPSAPVCCEDVTEWAASTCAAADPARLAELMSSCRPRPNCVSQIMKGGGGDGGGGGGNGDGGAGTCGAPSRERCCTRVFSNPAATLRVNLREEVVLSSVTLWLEGAAGGLLADDAQLDGADISIGSTDQMTGCQMLTGSGGDGIAAATAGGGAAGYAQFPLVCGAGGQHVELSFPRLAAGRPGTLAVRVCSVLAADQDPFWPATLRVQTTPAYQ